VPIHDRLDEMHAKVHRAMPADLMDFDDIPGVRRRVRDLRSRMRRPAPPDDVQCEDVLFGRDQTVNVRIYRPLAPRSAGAVLWIHGGGMVLGDLDMEDVYCSALCTRLGAMVIQVDYRLAPEHPFPAALDDCIAVFEHLVDHSVSLSIDPRQIIVGGASGGGNLAAALCLDRRDSELAPSFQFLMYPLLDDRIREYASPSADDPKVWNARDNANTWRAYLSGLPAGTEVPHLAAPARAATLAGLPPTHMCIGDLDLFLGEVLVYAGRLAGSGVPISLQVYPGAFHASNNFVSNSPIAKRWFEDDVKVLSEVLISV